MIPGITDRNRLPRLGKVRLGVTKTSRSGKPYPAAADHFVFDDVPELRERFGDNCREIFPILLPAEDEETWFPTSRSAYGKTGLFCRCTDGETAMRVFREEDQHGAAWLKSVGQVCRPGEFYDMPCPGEDCPYWQKGYCKNLGRLFFMVPDVPRFGVYEIATSSVNSIRNVLSVARAVKGMIGRVSGVPFALKLEPLQVQPDGRAKTVWVLNLECRASLAQLASIGKRLRAGGGALALIEAPDEVPEDLYPHGGRALEAGLREQDRPAPRSIEDLKASLAAPQAPEEDSPVAEATPVEEPEPAPATATPEPPPQPTLPVDEDDEALIDF